MRVGKGAGTRPAVRDVAVLGLRQVPAGTAVPSPIVPGGGPALPAPSVGTGEGTTQRAFSASWERNLEFLNRSTVFDNMRSNAGTAVGRKVIATHEIDTSGARVSDTPTAATARDRGLTPTHVGGRPASTGPGERDSGDRRTKRAQSFDESLPAGAAAYDNGRGQPSRASSGSPRNSSRAGGIVPPPATPSREEARFFMIQGLMSGYNCDQARAEEIYQAMTAGMTPSRKGRLRTPTEFTAAPSVYERRQRDAVVHSKPMVGLTAPAAATVERPPSGARGHVGDTSHRRTPSNESMGGVVTPPVIPRRAGGARGHPSHPGHTRSGSSRGYMSSTSPAQYRSPSRGSPALMHGYASTKAAPVPPRADRGISWASLGSQGLEPNTAMDTQTIDPELAFALGNAPAAGVQGDGSALLYPAAGLFATPTQIGDSEAADSGLIWPAGREPQDPSAGISGMAGTGAAPNSRPGSANHSGSGSGSGVGVAPATASAVAAAAAAEPMWVAEGKDEVDVQTTRHAQRSRGESSSNARMTDDGAAAPTAGMFGSKLSEPRQFATVEHSGSSRPSKRKHHKRTKHRRKHNSSRDKEKERSRDRSGDKASHHRSSGSRHHSREKKRGSEREGHREHSRREREHSSELDRPAAEAPTARRAGTSDGRDHEPTHDRKKRKKRKHGKHKHSRRPRDDSSVSVSICSVNSAFNQRSTPPLDVPHYITTPP